MGSDKFVQNCFVDQRGLVKELATTARALRQQARRVRRQQLERDGEDDAEQRQAHMTARVFEEAAERLERAAQLPPQDEPLVLDGDDNEEGPPNLSSWEGVERRRRRR
ncbi:MAG: hypothetical protein JWM53_955 [bacterium]|nr:hypothetical protein [bacterium]